MNIESKKILCIDDDAFVLNILKTYLTAEGFDVSHGASGLDLKRRLKIDPPDLIILDLVLPDQDGISLIRELKSNKATSYIPVIMVSSKGEDIDRVIGLEAGADDYIGKPFLPREIKARINAVLARSALQKQARDMPAVTDERLCFGEWTLDPDQYQAFDTRNNSAQLTTSEFVMLYDLAQNAQRVLTREHLFEVTRHINADNFDRAVDVQITRIRKKLRDNARSPRYIQTVRGVGYLFCARIEKESGLRVVRN